MKPVSDGHRKVININDAEFKNWELTGGGSSGQSFVQLNDANACLLYTSPSPRDGLLSRMPSSA